LYSSDGNSKKKELDCYTQGWQPQTRSIINPPELYQSGSTIYIDSSITLQNLQITVKDLSGSTLYSETTTVYGGIEYSFTLGFSTGEYMIELTHGTQYLYGYFVIE